jgi:hypothetical protein
MIPRLILALSLTVALSAQPADLVAHIETGPYDEHGVTTATVDVLARAPLADPERIHLDVLTGPLAISSWKADPGLTCEEMRSRLDCKVAPLAAGEARRLTLVLFNPNDPRGGIGATLTWQERGHRPESRRWSRELYRYRSEYAVTNTGDDGPGSLRQAILDANAGCTFYYTPCLLRFDLARPATIRPLTPLPPIEGDELIIEGGGVTVDGSLLGRPANGLVLAAGGMTVIRGLTVRDFPENGIESSQHMVRIESAAITGNGSRGLAAVRGGTTYVTDSVLSDNGRSGIFVDAFRVDIERTVIERNGASGVFYGPRAAGTIVDSVIAHNGHFGVGTMRENRNVDVGRNHIFGNRIAQIDIGLDGPSFFPFVRNEYAPPNGPALASATYDAATNTTTIRGRLEHVEISHFLRYEVQFFANDRFIGAIPLGEADFVFTLRGDLRGQLVTATSIRFLSVEFTERTTSELSAPIEAR